MRLLLVILLLFAIILSGLTVLAWKAFAQPDPIAVRVRPEGSPVSFAVAIPSVLIRTALLPLDLANVRVEPDPIPPDAVEALSEILGDLARAEDFVIASHVSAHESVRVSKRGDRIRVVVHDHDGRVQVDVPLALARSIVDAVD